MNYLLVKFFKCHERASIQEWQVEDVGEEIKHHVLLSSLARLHRSRGIALSLVSHLERSAGQPDVYHGQTEVLQVVPQL